jgi:hypothetical protein
MTPGTCTVGVRTFRIHKALARHVALVLLTSIVLQVPCRRPEETLAAVKSRLQLELVRGNMAPPALLRAKAALLSKPRK